MVVKDLILKKGTTVQEKVVVVDHDDLGGILLLAHGRDRHYVGFGKLPNSILLYSKGSIQNLISISISSYNCALTSLSLVISNE